MNVLYNTIVLLFFFIIVTGLLGILGSKQNSIYDMDLTFLKTNINTNLKSQVIELFENRQVYLNKNLTIWDICYQTNSNRTYISNLINQEFKMNFNSFVNKYRVEKAKELLEDENCKNDCLENIANKSGFNSLASFNRAFHRFEKVSPGSYRNLVFV